MQELRAARISIFLATTLLIAIGVIAIYSSSMVYAYDKFGDNFFFLKRHLVSLVIGIAAALVFMHVDLSVLRNHSKKFLFAREGFNLSRTVSSLSIEYLW